MDKDRQRTDELTVEILENLRAALREERAKTALYKDLVDYLIQILAADKPKDFIHTFSV